MIIKTFKIEKSKRLWILIFFALLIATTLIVISFVCIYFFKGDKTKGNNIFKINGYEVEYELTVISNKTNNTYYIHEWYIENEEKEYLKFEFENELQEKIAYIFKDNSINIKNENQINNLNIKNYNFIKENLISLSTFIGIYRNFELQNSNEVKIEKNNTNEKSVVTITGLDNKISKNSLFKNELKVSKLELVLNQDNIPIEYYVLDKNDEAIIGIKYTKFNVLEKFDEKIFANLNK